MLSVALLFTVNIQKMSYNVVSYLIYDFPGTLSFYVVSRDADSANQCVAFADKYSRGEKTYSGANHSFGV